MKMSVCRRVVAACMAVVLLSSVTVRAQADNTEELKERLNELSEQLAGIAEEREDIKEKIAGTSSEKEKKLAEKTHWESQIGLTRQEIDLLQERIDLLIEQIGIKQDEIEDKESEIDYNFNQYKKRMRATYMAGQSSNLSMLLGASGFTDLLIRSEFIRVTAEHDEALVQSLRKDRAELEEAKEDLNRSLEAVEADQNDLEDKQKELEGQLQITQEDIQSISMLEQEYLNRQAELQAMDQKVQAELDQIYMIIGSSGEYVGGIFGWPVPGYTTITSYYGWRFNNTNFHTGIDIAGSGVYGKSVVASNSGRVAYVQTTYTDGVGYGKYVIVDHGGGYTSLYAHLSSISVSVGDVVTRGVSEIGKVGSTGWSTGPHLHFEVRVDGKHQNPLEYLKSSG